jgi:hypothetical protein
MTIKLVMMSRRIMKKGGQCGFSISLVTFGNSRVMIVSWTPRTRILLWL